MSSRELEHLGRLTEPLMATSLDGTNLDSQCKRDTIPFHPVTDDVSSVRVFSWQNAIKLLKQRDLTAEPRESLSDFAPDRTTTNYG